MKIKLGIFLLILGLGIGYGVWDRYRVPIGGMAIKNTTPHIENFSFEKFDGSATYHLSDFKDKVVLVNFWATWCPPCLEEFPDLIRLANQYPEQLVILALSVDQNTDDIGAFLQAFSNEADTKLPTNMIIGHDSGQIIALNTFNVDGYPESFILNHKREIVYHKQGIIDLTDQNLHTPIKK